MSAERQQDRGGRGPQQPGRLQTGEPFVQEDQAEDDGKGRVEGGEDHRDGEQLPLGGEEIEDQAEGGPGPDKERLGGHRGRARRTARTGRHRSPR